MVVVDIPHKLLTLLGGIGTLMLVTLAFGIDLHHTEVEKVAIGLGDSLCRLSTAVMASAP